VVIQTQESSKQLAISQNLKRKKSTRYFNKISKLNYHILHIQIQPITDPKLMMKYTHKIELFFFLKFLKKIKIKSMQK
jgi:hypothetical protein